MRRSEGVVSVSSEHNPGSCAAGRRGQFRRLACLALTALIGFVIAGVNGSAFASSRKPNLIIVVTDDQGVDAVEGANWPNDLNVRMPTIATLADRGRVFTNARVNSACSPTRAALMTGRTAFQTGVTGVIGFGQPLPNRDLVSLHTSERTLAEVLKDAGYYTILIDKWHLGWSDEVGTNPEQQGFDVFLDYEDYREFDDPLAIGDEHITRSVNHAIEAVNNRPDPDQPYALFFWSIDPHKRVDPSGREPLLWWKVHSDLHPSGEDYYALGRDNERNRYRAVLEAFDTEFRRLLRTLDVITDELWYRQGSNTVVFYMSDNGTPGEVAPDSNKAKTTLYEGGVRVPFFVFGENVPQDGQFVNRKIWSVDLFDTICDMVEMPLEYRGDRPRMGISFADSIGWLSDPQPSHRYQLVSRRQGGSARHQVGLIGSRYKLLTSGGNLGLDPKSPDEFYDLLNDPQETVNLVEVGMTADERATYQQMLNDVVDYWPAAVSTPSSIHLDVPATHVVSVDSRDQLNANLLTVGHEVASDPGARSESRVLVRFDIASIPDLLPPGRELSDVVGAQVILRFENDSTSMFETETAPLEVRPVTRAWMDRPDLSWTEVVNAFVQYDLGSIDIAPHVIPDPGGNLSGVPLSPNTPISFGNRSIFLRAIQRWLEQPASNNGVMIMAEPYDDLEGDQRVNFRPTGAVLRLVFVNPRANP